MIWVTLELDVDMLRTIIKILSVERLPVRELLGIMEVTIDGESLFLDHHEIFQTLNQRRERQREGDDIVPIIVVIPSLSALLALNYVV